MKVVNTHKAKTELSKLLKKAAEGEEVIIGKAGQPIAKLVPFSASKKQRRGGQLKDKIHIAEDFESLPPGFTQHFSEEK